jgi:hypothetical protein
MHAGATVLHRERPFDHGASLGRGVRAPVGIALNGTLSTVTIREIS